MLGLLGSLLESSGGGGGGSPGGSNTQVQFNDAGSFGGDAGFTYNKTTDSLTLAGGLNYGSATASTAAAFDSSKNLVSVTNTGTGDNVLATSPTFTTSTTTAGTGGTVIQTLSSGASGGIYNTVIANYDFTSDATPVLIYTLTLATNTTYAIKGFVRGRRSGGGGSAGDSSVFNFFGCVKNVAGTVSIVSTIDVISKLDIAGPNITFSTSGATLQFYVTGVAATNINWSFFLETFGR